MTCQIQFSGVCYCVSADGEVQEDGISSDHVCCKSFQLSNCIFKFQVQCRNINDVRGNFQQTRFVKIENQLRLRNIFQCELWRVAGSKARSSTRAVVPVQRLARICSTRQWPAHYRFAHRYEVEQGRMQSPNQKLFFQVF